MDNNKRGKSMGKINAEFVRVSSRLDNKNFLQIYIYTLILMELIVNSSLLIRSKPFFVIKSSFSLVGEKGIFTYF